MTALTPKADALAALAKVREMLTEDAPLTAFRRSLLLFAFDYAVERVGAVDELKRKRKAPAERAEEGRDAIA